MSKGPLVAIVDDDKSIRNATQDLLKAAGSSTATSDLLGFDSEHDQIRTQS